jgi:hypothetical protein
MATLTLNQGGAGADKDTAIRSSFSTYNYGADNNVYTGYLIGTVRRGLFLADLSSIPSGSTISSATLSLYLRSIASGDNTVSGYRSKRAWLEGTGTGNATGDGATWATYNGTNSWQTAGGMGANDAESDAITARATTVAEGVGSKAFTLDTAKVSGWVDGTFANNGLLLKSGTEDSASNCSWYSAEHSTSSLRPSWVVEYTPPSAGNPYYYRMNQ